MYISFRGPLYEVINHTQVQGVFVGVVPHEVFEKVLGERRSIIERDLRTHVMDNFPSQFWYQPLPTGDDITGADSSPCPHTSPATYHAR